MSVTTKGKFAEPNQDPDFSEEELAMLSDEERAALEEENDKFEDTKPEPEDKTEENDDAGEEKAEDESEEKSEEDDEAGDEGESGEAKDDSEKPAAKLPDNVVEAKGDPFIPQLEDTDVEGYEEKIQELAKLYEEGEMSLAEYTQKTGELAALKTAAELNRRNNEILAEQRWEADKAAFFALNPAFKEENDPDLYDALDAKLRRMAAAGELDGMSGPEALTAAAKAVIESRKAFMPNEAETKPDERPRPKPKKVDIPTGLGDVPAAQDNAAGKSKFAYLDDLEGEALEEAVAKLSEADRIEYEKLL